MTKREHTPRVEDASEKRETRAQNVHDLEASLGRAAVRVSKLETQLAHAQAQVAWLHRNLFGQKREHVDASLLEHAWKDILTQKEREQSNRPRVRSLLRPPCLLLPAVAMAYLCRLSYFLAFPVASLAN